MKIGWYGKHFGEEPPISGKNGSGTIFFCGCNLKCVFCQNWQISQENFSCKTVSEAELLKIIFYLQNQGAGNINLVSPTIWTGQLIEPLKKVKQNGLKIPVVWNTNGYEEVEILKKLEGLVDIYLPDYKYSDDELAVKYSSAPNYSQIGQNAVLEMYRQVGIKGLIIRHLILPGQINNSINCLKFIRSISPKIYLSLMTQYNPCYKSENFPEINRKISMDEYQIILNTVRELGFENGWIQEFGESTDLFMPDFSKKNPFDFKV